MYDDEATEYNLLALKKKAITKMCKDAWKEMDKEDKKEFIEKHSDDLKDKKKDKKTRAPSAFILYSTSHREEIKKKYPGM